MDPTKKAIRAACKVAHNYHAWRNPMGVWFVTLFDANDEGTIEFQFDESFPKREKMWVWSQLEKIDARKEKRENEERL